MLCSSFDRPKIAVCVHGAARSFPHVLVHASLKKNLIDAIGADSTVFLHVSRKDARGDPRESVGGRFRDASDQDIQHAAGVLGIKREHMVIVEEALATLPDCPSYHDAYQLRKASWPGKEFVQGLEYLHSLAGQLSHREGCMRLVREEEKATHTTFDSVILARADLTYYSAMPPYCMFDHMKPRRYWDWFYHVPRSQADGLFSAPHRMFYGCKKCLRMGEWVEHYIDKNADSPNPKDDERMSVLVTRLDESNMPQACDRFHSTYENEVKAEVLCGPMTFQNAYNSIAGPSNV